MTPRRRSPAGGFTLLEILFGVGIFLTAMVGLSSLLTGTMRANDHARNTSAATNLASDKLEELASVAYAAVTSGADSLPLTESGAPGGNGAIYTRSWAVTAGPETDTKLVTVTVTWPSRTVQLVQLQSVIAE